MSILSLWRDPFAEVDILFRQTFGQVARSGQPAFTPAAEIVRDGADGVVRVELPGIDVTKDVAVEVISGQLVVRGERRDERTAQRGSARLREVRYGSFRRSFDLPQHVSEDAVTASYDAGVLTVRVAGAFRGSEPRKIEIASGGTTGSIEPGVEQPAGSDSEQHGQAA